MVKPGKSITQVYRIKNAADATTMTVKVVPFTAADEHGQVALQFDQTAANFFSLLNADLPDLPLTIEMDAGETRELVLKINVPAGTPEQDYPTALVIESQTQGLIGGSGSTTNAVIASPILLTVSESGLPQKVAQIVEFSTNKIVDSFEPVEFIVRVKNQSFNLLQPIGQITIDNTFGRKVATIPLEPDNILGGTIRQLRRQRTAETALDDSEEANSLSWNPVFPLGRYTATASLTPQDSTNTVSAEIVFWYLPYKATLTLLIILGGWKLFKSRADILK
jgi:hypothetical protein